MEFHDCYLLLPGRRIERGSLTIADGRIAEIRCDSPGGSAAEGPRFLVMPGLVNCHGHTAMTLLRGRGGGLPLQRWLTEAIFPIEAKMTPEDVRAGARWGIFEMLAGGTTCVADMYDFPDEMILALLEAGMRGRVCRVGLSIVPGRLDDCISFTRSHNEWMRADKKSEVLADICIHSEYLTDEPFCRALAAANRTLRRPVHFHVSETEKEHRECIARHGKTPIAYLADTGLLDFGGYAAHGVWCTDDDFRIMAEKGVSLVHCPSSNMKLGSGFARIPRAMELGVNVALGTDGCASNDNLDMFEEMHLASLLHKGVAHDPTALSPWDVIEMATINGARALGLEDRIGSIEVGKDADLCVIDLRAPHLTPCLDVASLVVHSMHASDVTATLLKGDPVYDRGALAYDGTPGRDRMCTPEAALDGPPWTAAEARRDFLSSVRRLGLL